MIDVFIRNNFTADTNAMAVGFLHEFADAEEAIGNATGSAKLRRIASAVAQATDAMLFCNETDDHYVTQLNPDGSARDFVDYDANLIALAHGVPSAERAKRVFHRVDGGRCVHGRATYVSEKLYDKNDTTSGNTAPWSDARSSMGRIGWFDALARKRYGDQATFDTLLIDPLIDDVNRWTWLHERYDCDGKPQQRRTSHYFEYPSVVAMMLHFVRYGIQLGFGSVSVSPFGPRDFKYHVGSMHLEYNSDAGIVRLAMPGRGNQSIRIDGLEKNRDFTYKVGPGSRISPWPAVACNAVAEDKAISSSDGVLSFAALIGDEVGPCVIAITAGSPIGTDSSMELFL